MSVSEKYLYFLCWSLCLLWCSRVSLTSFDNSPRFNKSSEFLGYTRHSKVGDLWKSLNKVLDQGLWETCQSQPGQNWWFHRFVVQWHWRNGKLKRTFGDNMWQPFRDQGKTHQALWKQNALHWVHLKSISGRNWRCAESLLDFKEITSHLIDWLLQFYIENRWFSSVAALAPALLLTGPTDSIRFLAGHKSGCKKLSKVARRKSVPTSLRFGWTWLLEASVTSVTFMLNVSLNYRLTKTSDLKREVLIFAESLATAVASIWIANWSI